MIKSPTPTQSISAVTARLIEIILKMPFEQRIRLLSELSSDLSGEQPGIDRKHPRKNFFMDVVFLANDHIHSGFIQNISTGGIFVECRKDVLKRLEPDQPIILTFDHPDKKIHVKITGKITRIDESGFGVNFDDLLQGLSGAL